MSKLLIAVVATTLIAAPVVAQTPASERVIATITASGWVFFGDNQTRERVADPAATGKSAIRVTIPRDGGTANAATGQSPIKPAIAAGETVRVTIWLKGVSTVAGGPAKAIVKLKDAGKPYGTYAEKTLDLTSEWKPYSVDYSATRAFAGGSTNMMVQLALGRQTVDVGNATAVILAR